LLPAQQNKTSLSNKSFPPSRYYYPYAQSIEAEAEGFMNRNHIKKVITEQNRTEQVSLPQTVILVDRYKNRKHTQAERHLIIRFVSCTHCNVSYRLNRVRFAFVCTSILTLCS